MILCLFDSLRGQLDSLKNWLNFPIEHAHFVVHLEKFCIGVVPHSFKYLLRKLLFCLEFDCALSLYSFQLLNIVGRLLLIFALFKRLLLFWCTWNAWLDSWWIIRSFKFIFPRQASFWGHLFSFRLNLRRKYHPIAWRRHRSKPSWHHVILIFDKPFSFEAFVSFAVFHLTVGLPDVFYSSLLICKIFHLLLKSLVHLLSPGPLDVQLFLKFFNKALFLLKSLSDHLIDFFLWLVVLYDILDGTICLVLVLLVKLAQVRCLFAWTRVWVVHRWDVVFIIHFLRLGNFNAPRLGPATHLGWRQSSLGHWDLWSVLHFVVEQRIVGFLVIFDELVDILVDLNCRGCNSTFVLELNVVFARLFCGCLDLNCIAGSFEYLGGLVWKIGIIIFAGLDNPFLSLVDIHIEVLSCGSAFIPIASRCWLCFVFGTDLFL